MEKVRPKFLRKPPKFVYLDVEVKSSIMKEQKNEKPSLIWMLYWHHVGKEGVRMYFKAEARRHTQDWFFLLYLHFTRIPYMTMWITVLKSPVLPVFSSCTQKHSLGSFHAWFLFSPRLYSIRFPISCHVHGRDSFHSAPHTLLLASFLEHLLGISTAFSES